MKAKKTISILAIIIGSFFLVIAYAAIANQVLTISGTATATTSDANFEVKLASHESFPTFSSGNGAIDVNINQDGKSATIRCMGMCAKGDMVQANFLVKNLSPEDIDAYVTTLVTNPSPEWYDITTFWSGTRNYYDTTISQGDFDELSVMIQLKKTPITDDDVFYSSNPFYVRIDAQPQ